MKQQQQQPQQPQQQQPQQPRAPEDAELPDLSVHVPLLQELALLPAANAFACLSKPMLAYGAGLHLKSAPPLPALRHPLPGCATTSRAPCSARAMAACTTP